jgi:hypothetical protein
MVLSLIHLLKLVFLIALCKQVLEVQTPTDITEELKLQI